MALLNSIMIAVLCAIIYFAAFGLCQTVDNCPPALPRDTHLTIHGSYCFQFQLTHKISHTEARADCEKNGGTLALIKTQDIQDFIYDQLMHTYKDFSDKVWIGLNDIAIEDHFVWEDGDNMTYSNWANGEDPNGGSFQHALQHNSEDCVVLDMSSGGKWHDYACDSSFVFIFSSPEKHSYICQYLLTSADLSSILPGGTTTTFSSISTTLETSTTSSTFLTVETSTMSSGNTVTQVIESNPQTTDSVLINACPALSCLLDCGTAGFKKSTETGCFICECETS